MTPNEWGILYFLVGLGAAIWHVLRREHEGGAEKTFAVFMITAFWPMIVIRRIYFKIRRRLYWAIMR